MDDLAVIGSILGLEEDDAATVLELCDMLDREESIDVHGYPKDTPRGRDLAARLVDREYHVRLLELAVTEEASPEVVEALQSRLV